VIDERREDPLEVIAKAFLITPRTLAQRIVRAKARIRETPIPYEVPSPQEMPARLGAVLQVIYLVFNEGYSAAAVDFRLPERLSDSGTLCCGSLSQARGAVLLHRGEER